MFDQRYLRPLSGEIMTERSGPSAPVVREGDIVDAEFETLSPAAAAQVPPVAPPTRAEAQPSGNEMPPRTGMDMLRSRDAAGGKPERAGPLFWIAGAIVAAAAFWIAGGHALGSAALSRLAAAQVEPLRIAELTSRVSERGGRRLLYVDGMVRNDGRERHPVPPIAIEVVGDAGRVTRYTLDSAGALVDPGANHRFSSRVDAPAGGVAAVSVTLAKGND